MDKLRLIELWAAEKTRPFRYAPEQLIELYLNGFLGNLTADFYLNPLEISLRRFPNFNEHSSPLAKLYKNRNIFGTTMRIKENGFTKLYGELLAKYITMDGLNMDSQNYKRDKFTVIDANGKMQSRLYQNLSVGFISKATLTVVNRTPIEMFKLRIQNEKQRLKLGLATGAVQRLKNLFGKGAASKYFRLRFW
ncbi:uncharacterized protein LOC111518629 [Drosophila willistoni]|uniref:uncharacterized protein LOC111518629 n=1 Tax=Drosophila willistoni TaxID=7260 RepID=UPI001F078955|nr:uncharacterized protein LOC111518629 [Drosophila willistoni]